MGEVGWLILVTLWIQSIYFVSVANDLIQIIRVMTRKWEYPTQWVCIRLDHEIKSLFITPLIEEFDISNENHVTWSQFWVSYELLLIRIIRWFVWVRVVLAADSIHLPFWEWCRVRSWEHNFTRWNSLLPNSSASRYVVPLCADFGTWTMRFHPLTDLRVTLFMVGP